MRVDRIAHWIAKTSPGLHRFVLPWWRRVKRWVPLNDPWEKRKSFNYYTAVVQLAKAYAPTGQQVIDVGAGRAEMLLRLDWFERRVALDRTYAPRHSGIETILTDFLDYDPGTTFDLVLCLEVLEHLDSPSAFAQKLLRIGRTVIITVPYKWPPGTRATHKQDPVDEAKLATWTQRTPTETCVVADDRERLIAVYHLSGR